MQRLTSFSQLTAKVAERRRELGITDETIIAARNSGRRRTEAKRELLRRIQERARAAGVRPFQATY
jgi:hypothetical protein